MKSDPKLAMLILAAGQSSRLGQPKQSVLFHGQTLLLRQCQKALSLTEHVYCVLGYQARPMRDLLATCFTQEQVQPVINQHWQQGMSSSIAAGIAALPDDIDGVMIVLVDQWQLTSAAMAMMIQLWHQDPEQIVLAEQQVQHQAPQQAEQQVPQQKRHQRHLGPPVLFGKQFFAQLRQLTGPGGAKPMLAQHQDSLTPVNLAAAFVDLDTPEQLATLKASKQDYR